MTSLAVTEQIGGIMAKKKTDVPVALPDNRPATGRGGKYNFPNARLKRLEEDDSKRECIGKALNNILAIYDAAAEPPHNDDELCDRLNWFFKACAETHQIPTVEKMALALSWTPREIKALETRENRGFSAGTAEIIKKAKNLIASLDAELALDFKIQPAVYMFRAKNYYGMKDTQDVEISAKPVVEQPDVKALEAKYELLPDD